MSPVRTSAGKNAAAVASEIIPRVFILELPVLLLIMPHLIRPAPEHVPFWLALAVAQGAEDYRDRSKASQSP